MRQVMLFATAIWLAAGCDSASKEPTTQVKSENIVYPYTPEPPTGTWEIGSSENAVTALKALKAFETGNIDECMSYFADSVTFSVDGYDAKTHKDSLKVMIKGYRESLASFSIKMIDWLPVISKDKKHEWVSVWYKETWTDKDGKVDSAMAMNDFKMEGGKIAVLDEKTRKFVGK